jgi:sec-independent protein translocase protein TatA
MFGLPGGWEWLIILFVALMIFGKRLPEVGKSMGKTIVEFKKGLRGVQDEVDRADRKIEAAATSPTAAPQLTTEEHHVDHV